MLIAYYVVVDMFLAFISIAFLAPLQFPKNKKIILILVMNLGVLWVI